MNTQTHQPRRSLPRAAAVTEVSHGGQPRGSFLDNRPQLAAHAATQAIANNGPQVSQLQAFQAQANAGPQVAQIAQLQARCNACAEGVVRQRQAPASGQPVQAKANYTGLPDQLKAGLEHHSGLDMSDVRVHYNSSIPAQFNAHAITQGKRIDVAPGRERDVPHEAWHAVQQMQDRVRPTMELNGTPVNDSKSLEHEADVMGAKAARTRLSEPQPGSSSPLATAQAHAEGEQPDHGATGGGSTAQRNGDA